MNANQMQKEIEETLIRNLRILQEAVDASELRVSYVEAMLKACAANLAQVYADRVVDE
jgi:hypothetical protein